MVQRLFISFFILTFSICAAPAASDLKGVTEVSGAFVKAWNRHDASAIGALFESDADFVNYVGMHWKSRDEIVGGHEKVLKTFLKQSTLREIETTPKSLGGELALSRFKWELTGQLDPRTGRAVPPRTGLLFFVLKKVGASWKIVAAQNTDILPVPQVLGTDGARIK